MTLRNLAKHHKNAYREADPLAYGVYPHNPNTWDADMVQGCAPDVYGYYDSYDSSQNSSPQNITSYTGPGLENRECPVAFNPRVIDKTFNNGTKYIANYTHLKEIQRIECKAVQGYVTLQFRGMTSGQIHVNSTVAEVTAKLEAVPSVGDVSVKFALPSNNFCEYALSQYADITFESELGNVPLLAVAESTLYGNQIYITRAQTGSTDMLVECGGYGECDRTTGLCRCWDYQGTSDGVGGIGDRGDCGHNLIN